MRSEFINSYLFIILSRFQKLIIPELESKSRGHRDKRKIRRACGWGGIASFGALGFV